MKYGIHYAYWQKQWHADLIECCKRAAKLGFDLLEISGDALLLSTEAELKELKQVADECGIGINPCQGMPADSDPGSEDAAARARGIDFAKRMFDKMALIDSRQIGGILYSYWPALSFSNRDVDIKRARELSLESMAVIADEAKQRGLLLTLEVVNRYENFIFNDAKGALSYLDDLGRDNVKLLLDVFHMNIEEDSIGDAIRMTGDRLGHFHIGECNRKVPGSGHMPWQEIATALKDIGYTGGVVMEPFVRSEGEVADAIRVWRDLVEPSENRLDSDLSKALAFTKSVFE